MGGYIVTGDHPWDYIERISGMKRQEFEKGTGHSLLLTPDGNKYCVDDIEVLFTFAADAPDLNTRRYCIIDKAEYLTEIIQNKLLKILEDGSILFFLIAPDNRSFLATIKSRLITVSTGSQVTVSQLEQFRNLNERRDLFFRLHLLEKDEENSFFSMSMPDFLLGVERLFLESLSNDIMALGRLWTEEERIEILSLCERYLAFPFLTKEDLFNFVAHICAL